MRRDLRISIFEMGSISKNIDNELYASLVFPRILNSVVKIRNNHKNFISFRKLEDYEKNLIFEAMEREHSQIYIQAIKDKTGYDLKQMEDYKDYLIKKNTEKFNL